MSDASLWSTAHAAAVIDVADGLIYAPDVVTRDEEREILDVLEGVPDRPPGQHDPRRGFAFSRPLIDGVPLVGRREAAAGWPIWFDGAPIEGVPMPPPLATLRGRVEHTLLAAGIIDGGGHFTSVYVDRYESGGYFVPHVDRDCYGPLVAGVSLGPATARITFTSEVTELREPVPPVELELLPRSLYVFSGRLRRRPWHHGVHAVTDVRFGVTFRSPSAEML